MGWCPYDGEECHHDGYCSDCEHSKEQVGERMMTDERKRDLLREVLTMKKYNYTLAPDWVFNEIVFAISRPERPQGEWKFIGDNLLVCTECGYVNDATWLGNWRLRTCDSTYPHACPNCGADMRKEGEEK